VLPLRERILIRFSPRILRLAHFGRGWSGVPRECRTVPVTPQAERDDWRPAAAELDRQLATTGARGAALEVVLSNHLVRYALLPWMEGIGDEDEALAYARHLFESTYGEDASAWQICLGERRRGEPRVAAAAAAELVKELGRSAAAHGLRFTRLLPALSYATDRLLPKPEILQGWLACAEPDRVCLMRVEDGVWSQIVNARADGDVTELLRSLLEQDALVSGLSAKTGQVLLAAGTGIDALRLRASGWQVVHAAGSI
jgi:hypothetical protein